MKRAAAIVILLALLFPSAASAACPKTSLAEIEHEVMCPVCGVPLGLATEAPQAQRQREFIQREVAACKSEDQIKTALVAEFGERVLALPPEEGFNLAAYLVPAAAVAVGAGAVGFVALRRRRGPQTGAPDAAAVDIDDEARLDADLERYEL